MAQKTNQPLKKSKAQHTKMSVDLLTESIKNLSPDNQLRLGKWLENAAKVDEIRKKSGKSENQSNHNYIPFTLSDDDIQILWESDEKGGAIWELNRVANNIWDSLNNPDTPEIVKIHIRNYFHETIAFEVTNYRSAIQILFTLGCMQVSEIPFIPNRDYIEALTSGDIAKSEKAVKDNLHIDIYISPSPEIVKQLVESLTLPKISDVEDIPILLASLLCAVGKETNPEYRERMIIDILHQLFFSTMWYSNEYESFYEKALKNLDNLEVSNA